MNRQVDRFRHEALLYAGWTDFVAETVPFIRGGLDAGEPVLVVESPEKIDVLRMALDREADHVMFANMSDVGANPALIIPAWHDFVAEHGVKGRRLRGIGEPIWKGRSDDELIECQRHESLLNVAFGGGQAWWLLCPYDTEKLDASVIDEARRSHEFLTEAGSAQPSPDFRGIEASGAPFAAPLPESRPLLRLMFGPDDLGRIRAAVRAAAKVSGLDVLPTAELVAAVNEVATNSVLHGGGGGSFQAWRETDRVVCEVADRGRYSDPLADRVRPRPDTHSPRGLWLANQMCDLVQIRTLPAGTTVRLHKRIERRHRLRVLDERG